jgi:hypothetical protein
MNTTIQPGATVRILADRCNPTATNARVDRISERTGMVYLTDQQGGDRVCFADELRPAEHCEAIPEAVPQEMRPKPVRVCVPKPAKVPKPQGWNVYETAVAASCGPDYVRESIRAGRLKATRRTERDGWKIKPEDAKAWIAKAEKRKRKGGAK